MNPHLVIGYASLQLSLKTHPSCIMLPLNDFQTIVLVSLEDITGWNEMVWMVPAHFVVYRLAIYLLHTHIPGRQL